MKAGRSLEMVDLEEKTMIERSSKCQPRREMLEGVKEKCVAFLTVLSSSVNGNGKKLAVSI